MERYNLLSLTCKLCDWQWEITPQEKTDNITCEQCGCSNIFIEKKTLQIIKKSGKIISEIGYASHRDKFGGVKQEDESREFKKPLLLIRENDFKFIEDISNNDRVALLGKIETIRSKIVKEIKESTDGSFRNIL